MWQYLVLIVSLSSLLQPSNAFWWPKATTETPRAQVLQQIPLTYFRTYTYQPLRGDPFGMPLFGFGAAQTPLLSERPFDPYAVTSYAAARRHDVNAPGYKPEVTPPDMAASSSSSASLGSSSSASSTTPAPTTTTTSTTTTTTPAPTTTTTTTTSSTTPAPPPPPPPTESSAPPSSLRYGAYNTAEYPTYNRRVNNLYNARPQYPYPDYFNYQPPAPPSASSEQQKPSGSRIQFVPCMCPVSMPSLSGMSNLGLTSHPTSTERDRPSSVSISSVPLPVPVEATELSPALQSRHIESEEAELDDESEASSSSSGEAEADADVSVAVDSKLSFEPPNTTPTVESNSVV